MSKLNNKSIHEKAIRLLEGGVVEVDGLFVRAVNLGTEYDCCSLCEMDSLCFIGTEMQATCSECDFITNGNYRLILVSKKR